MQPVNISLLPVITISYQLVPNCLRQLYLLMSNKKRTDQKAGSFFYYLIFGVASMVSVLPAAQR